MKGARLLPKYETHLTVNVMDISKCQAFSFQINAFLAQSARKCDECNIPENYEQISIKFDIKTGVY
jgi:hypothetical protein